MVRRQALIVEAHGERFRFYYDLQDPGVLHITRQHGTTPEDAIRTFLAGVVEPWDEEHLRFAIYTETHGLFWTRHAHDQSVIVISCFKRGDEQWPEQITSLTSPTSPMTGQPSGPRAAPTT